MRIEFSLPDGSVGKNVTIFGADMRSSVHINNKGKDILILGKSLTQGLRDTTLTVESQYSISFTRPNIKFCPSLHYNVSDSFLFLNTTKIYQFKAKDYEIKMYSLCLGNISGDFSANNMRKNRIKWMGVHFFC